MESIVKAVQGDEGLREGRGAGREGEVTERKKMRGMGSALEGYRGEGREIA